jgi:hypothetical protein
VRRLAVARDDEELELGVRCMAAGIFDDQGKLVAGLSISAPSRPAGGILDGTGQGDGGTDLRRPGLSGPERPATA